MNPVPGSCLIDASYIYSPAIPLMHSVSLGGPAFADRLPPSVQWLLGLSCAIEDRGGDASHVLAVMHDEANYQAQRRA